jgi:quercetin dioxygenase-like cupin family protein
MNIPVMPKSIISEINYQSEAIVSKQLLKKNNGTVTLYAFDRNEALNDSTSPFDILVHVLEGTIDLKVNGTSNLIKASEYFSLPAKIPYSIEAKEKTKILLTVIK